MKCSKKLTNIKEIVCKPFWNELTKEWSNKLWLPNKTDCVDTASNSWNDLSKSIQRNTWFTIKKMNERKTKTEYKNSQTTCLSSSLSSWIDKTNKDLNIEEKVEEKKMKPQKKPKKQAEKAKLIRVYPSKEQKKLLASWFGVARWTYNQCLFAIKNKLCTFDKKSLRGYAVNKNAVGQLDWVSKVPYEIRDQAMIDLFKAYESNFAKQKKNKKRNQTFQVKFRSKKRMKQESISIRSRDWGRKRGIFSSIFRNDKLVGKDWKKEPLPETIDYQFRLVRTRLGAYYLAIPEPLQIQRNNKQVCLKKKNRAKGPGLRPHSVISLDPGVRTFQTGYDVDGAIWEWGGGDVERLDRLQGWNAKLCSRIKKEPNKRRRYCMRKASLRINLKIRNLVDELHKRMAKWLCESYQTILISPFNVQDMIKKSKRKIGKKTVRRMLMLSHFRFRQRLINKAREYPLCNVIVTPEPYTSKTCGKCGIIHKSLGNAKTFVCPNSDCGFEVDRDANGARNILLRYLTLERAKESLSFLKDN